MKIRDELFTVPVKLLTFKLASFCSRSLCVGIALSTARSYSDSNRFSSRFESVDKTLFLL